MHGTATAATLWSTAAVGASVAYSKYEIAVVLTVANFAVLRWMPPLQDAVSEEESAPESDES